MKRTMVEKNEESTPGSFGACTTSDPSPSRAIVLPPLVALPVEGKDLTVVTASVDVLLSQFNQFHQNRILPLLQSCPYRTPGAPRGSLFKGKFGYDQLDRLAATCCRRMWDIPLHPIATDQECSIPAWSEVERLELPTSKAPNKLPGPKLSRDPSFEETIKNAGKQLVFEKNDF